MDSSLTSMSLYNTIMSLTLDKIWYW